MVVSAALTVALFVYVGWQAVVTPSGSAPEAQVLGTETMSDGSVVVVTEVRNPQDVGLRSITVESNCTTPPPELQYRNVPADDRRVGRIVCPPGTTNPRVSVSTWVEA